MPDYNFLMETRLRPEQLRVVNGLGRLAAAHGLNLYLAGTAVLDLTLGAATVRDLSFVAEGDIQKILRPLSLQAGKRNSARAASPDGFEAAVLSVSADSKGSRGTVRFEGGVEAEISATRNETYGAPGRPPAVSPGTVFDDLRRRDFSANAMAISLHPNSRGLLLDPTNGAADIERRELRALHSRSFFDDSARIYRLFRLSSRLNFKPDDKTSRWLGMTLGEKTWESLSEVQQGRELRAILEEEAGGRILKALGEQGLLGGLDRKLASARIDFIKFERVRTAIHTASADDDALLLNFQALVANLPGADQNRLAKKVLGDSKTIQLALGFEREAAKLVKLLGGAQAARPSQVYALLTGPPRPLVVFLQAHYPQATVQSRVKSFFTRFPAIRAALPRAELESLGLPPGPKFEKVLEQLFVAELDGKIKTPQQRTKALQDYAGIKVAPPPPAPAAKSPSGKVRGGAKAVSASIETSKSKPATAPAPAAEKRPTARVAKGQAKQHAVAGKPARRAEVKAVRSVKTSSVKAVKSASASQMAKKPKQGQPLKAPKAGPKPASKKHEAAKHAKPGAAKPAAKKKTAKVARAAKSQAAKPKAKRR